LDVSGRGPDTTKKIPKGVQKLAFAILGFWSALACWSKAEFPLRRAFMILPQKTAPASWCTPKTTPKNTPKTTFALSYTPGNRKYLAFETA
jgi:hypothetical protein